MNKKPQYIPIVNNQAIRTFLAFLVLAVCFIAIHQSFLCLFSSNFLLLLTSWLFSIWLTDKYQHKYPQRYLSYLAASHMKSTLIMAVVLLLGVFFLENITDRFWVSFLVFSFVDFAISLPHKQLYIDNSQGNKEEPDSQTTAIDAEPHLSLDKASIIRQLKDAGPNNVMFPLCEMVNEAIPENQEGEESLLIINADSPDSESESNISAAFLWMNEPINYVKRFNLYLQYVTRKTPMGGFFAFSYKPLEYEIKALVGGKYGWNRSFAYLIHFLIYRALPKTPILETIYFSKMFNWLDNIIYSRTKTKRRVIPRAEMWGRMYYHGFRVLDEMQVGEQYIVLTQRFQMPEKIRKPSFYLVVSLTKVGLNGQLIKLHKLRSMYPFSEFIQEKIYNDQGLTNMGKFKDDFRLTEYGKFIRKYWLDEIPQIYDWLRGEIKLVGMRATSSQYLNLYPQELYDLYIQIKPGLIAPIFDAKTNGFDDIVRIELEYLVSYWKHPIATDIRYFFKTFNDIIFRGVRSK